MKEKFHETASYYADMLANVRNEILGRIQSVVEMLGGKINVRYYHDEADLDRNTFFEVNDDGYGVELYIDLIRTSDSGELEIHLTDTEDSYSYWWDLSDFNASNSLYLLYEVEAIAQYVEESGEEVVTEEED